MSGKYLLITMIFVSLSWFAKGQQTVEVVESVVKVGIKAEESVFYGFAEGDEIIFSYEEANGKEMREVEIVEMPSTSRFMDYKTTKIDNKKIVVTKTGIYKFRFNNSAIFPRVCKYKIQRIPKGPETQNFNTTVYYDSYNDTTYTTEIENFIDKSDTIINNYQERTVKVNNLTAPGSSKLTFNFTLPENTVSWSYYITADKLGQQAYQNASRVLSSSEDSRVRKFTNYNPVAAVALESPSYLVKVDTGIHINYWIVENDNADLFITGAQFRFIKKGKVINDFDKMEPRDRTFYFCLHNDYKEEPVSVSVKITAILINEKLSSRSVQRMHVKTISGMHLKN